MSRFGRTTVRAIVLFSIAPVMAQQPRSAKRYFAHPAVEDRHGVIAPWYSGQNGQYDFRVRVAEETLKRYPWAEPGQAVMPAPHYIFNGCWTIESDGKVQINPELKDWDNGDVGQRSIGLLFGQTEYYRYTGDPAAVGIITMTANYVLDYCQTPADHPWPQFFISCPTKGKAYGPADPHGFIQLDLTASAGSALVAAYKVTGDPRYLAAAQHWADLLAEHCNRQPGAAPWPRYANPEDVPAKDGIGADWGPVNVQTGGIALVLQFLDDVIRMDYRGKEDSLVKARAAGDEYLRDVLLPRWSQGATFGHNYWDWANPVYTFAVASYVSHYMMGRPEAFPGWERDVCNIMSLACCCLSVSPDSMGGVYSGAWALPEANNCCGKSLQYPVMPIAATLSRYAELSGSDWAREIARRQAILATYDAHETGVVEDLIDGGTYVAATWFNLAHPWPLKSLLEQMSWQPDVTGAGRENHIMRSTSVVSDVRYGRGRVAYRTYDTISPSEDVLRLAFAPKSVLADGKSLPKQATRSGIGYAVKPLSNGDCLVFIRHDGSREVVVEGDDPQELVEDESLKYEGAWTTERSSDASGGSLHVAETAGASVGLEFDGNQFRLVGGADPNGGKADVYIDGVRQLCGIDFWCPQARSQQILSYRNGLAQGKHTLKVVALGTKNAYAGGTRVYVDGVQWSAVQGAADFGEGSGPADAQRVIFGYLGREDYVDSEGHAWRPGLEFVMRLASLADVVPAAFWSEPRLLEVANTRDPELYRYGVHGRDFTAYFTVKPEGRYHARIKLCQAKEIAGGNKLATTIDIQGQTVAADVDIAATAGGTGRAVDLVFNNIRPEHGVIAIRFWNGHSGEAMVQAVEIGPGPSEPGAKPASAQVPK